MELGERPIKTILAEGYQFPKFDEEEVSDPEVIKLISDLQLMQCPVKTCGQRFGNFPLWKLHIEQVHKKASRFSCFCGQSQRVSRDKLIKHVICKHGAEAYDESFIGKKVKKRTIIPLNKVRYECLVCGVKLDTMTQVRVHVFHTWKYGTRECLIGKDVRVDTMPGEFIREGFDFRRFKDHCCLKADEKSSALDKVQAEQESASPANSKEAELDYQSDSSKSPQGNALIIAEEPAVPSATNQEMGQGNAFSTPTNSTTAGTFTDPSYSNSWGYHPVPGNQFYLKPSQGNIYTSNLDPLAQNYYQGETLPSFATIKPSPRGDVFGI